MLFGHAQQGVEVFLVGMDAAVAQQAQEMDSRLPTPLHELHEKRLLEEVAAQDGGVDARDFLVDDSARADVQVADFGISHEAVGKSHALARSMDQRPGVDRKSVV